MSSGLISKELVLDILRKAGLEPDIFDVIQAWVIYDQLTTNKLKNGDMPGIMRNIEKGVGRFEPAFQDPSAFAAAMLMAGWGEEIEPWESRFAQARASANEMFEIMKSCGLK